MTLPSDLQLFLNELRPAAQRALATERRRRRLLLLAAAVSVAVALATGIAAAAFILLGEPAPQSVQSLLDRSANAAFVPSGRFRGKTARVVAVARDATLYGFSDNQGNYCVELIGATRGLIFSLSCNVTSAAAGGGPAGGGSTGIDFVTTDSGVEPPVVRFGRLPSGATAARAVLADGTIEPIEIGLGRFYLYQPAERNQRLARQGPMTIEALDRSGSLIGSSQLEPPQPLHSEGTPARRVSGQVFLSGARRLEISPITGFHRSTYVPIRAGRRFDFTLPRAKGGITITVVDGRNRSLSVPSEPVPEAVWRQLQSQAAKPS